MTRCSACPTTDDGRFCSRQILPTGPDGRCDYLFLGAGPSKRESITLTPYTGLAGDELRDLYLPLADLRANNVVIGNASLCWDLSDRTPPKKRILSCAQHHLPALLDRVQPTVVVLMGGATQAICDKRIRLELHHGIPQYTSLLNGAWTGWVFPSYEPALGMRDTGMMTPLMQDFKRLGEWMRGEWTPPIPDDDAETDYQIADTPGDLYHYLYPLRERRGQPIHIAEDTESHGSELWSVQISHTPGTGRLIRATEFDVICELIEFNRELSDDLVWVMHHAQHDMDESRKIGLEFAWYRDTMQEAFQMCSLPQGLKALVYRLFGHEMQSWDDTVWPASIAVMKEWLSRGIDVAASHPLVTISELKMGKCTACGKRNKRMVCSACGSTVNFYKIVESATPLESILRHILRYTGQTEENEKPYHPWKKLAEMRENGLRGKNAEDWQWDWLMKEIGVLPVLGIGNCEERSAVDYACSDAAWTLQVSRKLEEMRGGKEWLIDREDYDQ